MRDQLNKGEHLSTPLKQKRKSFFQGGETKSMKIRKITASLLAFAMLLSLVAIPAGSADAATTYSAVEVPNVTKGAGTAVGAIKVVIDPIVDSSQAIIKLPGKIATVQAVGITSGATVGFGPKDSTSAVSATYNPNNKEVRIFVTGSAGAKVEFLLKLDIDTTDVSTGDVVATFTNLAGQLPSGTVTVAKAGSGSVALTAGSAKSISGAGNEVKVTVTESTPGSWAKDKTVTLRLPKNYKWTAHSVSTMIGAAASDFSTTIGGTDSRELTVTRTTTPGAVKAVLDIVGDIDVTKDASYGDVEVTVLGTVDSSVSSLLVAKYADFGAKVSAAEAKELVAGEDNKTVSTITIQEETQGSLIPGRTIYVTLPKDVDWNAATTITGDFGTIIPSRDDEELSFVVPTSPSKAGKIEIKGKVDVPLKFTGDVVATISGNAGIEGEVTVAKAVAPLTVVAEGNDVALAQKGQDIGKVIFTETKANRLNDGDKITLNILNEGVVFEKKPTVKVTDGDAEFKTSFSSTTPEAVTITVDADSSKATTFEVSTLLATVNRNALEGDLEVEIKLNNVKLTTVVVGQIGLEAVAKQEQVKFVLGATNYTVGGVEKAWEVAPFVQDGRSMLPVRALANLVGVGDDNILFDANTKTVTLFKGDRVAQIQVGSNVIKVNGVDVTIDTKAVIKEERTFLPLRAVAQALGVEIGWDEATRTVSIN